MNNENVISPELVAAKIQAAYYLDRPELLRQFEKSYEYRYVEFGPRMIEQALRSLLALDYPALEIIAVNDRSQDGTGAIIDEFAAKYPIIKAIHRRNGTGGKAAALRLATPQATGEVLLLFDADYFPGRAMIKQLVAPFCDPEVGAVMGRVVPYNTGTTLLPGIWG